MIEGGAGGGIGGEVDDQALVVAVAEIERFEVQAERADVGVAEGVDAGPACDEWPLPPTAGELLPTDSGEGLGERVYARVTAAVTVQEGDLFVDDCRPVGVGVPGSGVGEQAVEQVGLRMVEQAEGSGEPVVAVVPGEQVGEVVDHDGGGGVEPVEDGVHGGTDGACGALAGVGTQLGALADGGQLLQVFAVRGGEPQCLGQRGEDLDGGSGVAALFEADEVLHADPGQCGQLGAAQARCLASGTGGKADVGGSDGFPAAAEKSPSSLCITPSSLPRQLRGTGVPARTTRDIAHHRGASAAAARNPDAWLAQLSKRMPRIDSVPQADPYLALLDRALADRDLSSAEIRELGLVSNELGLTNRQLLKLHREYVRGLCQVAYADGEIGRDEHADLVRVTGLLRLTPADLDAATDNARSRRFPATELPTAGSLIAFTGDHPGYSRNLLVGMAERHGLTVHDPVTRKVALLVASDFQSQSTNARKARDYAIPIMPVGTFAKLVGLVR